MGEQDKIEYFTFESREIYDRAKKEMDVIGQICDKSDLSDGKMALKVYNKAIAEKSFSTVVGYCFLYELRRVIIESGVAEAGNLVNIPVKEIAKQEKDTIPEPAPQENKFQRLFKKQEHTIKKFKIAIGALIILLAGFVAINFRFEYTIFTYFTNYKANMENEIVNKYENWQSELEEREKKLNEKGY